MHNPNNKECPYNATRRGENWAKDGDCPCPPEQKEEWEEEFDILSDTQIFTIDGKKGTLKNTYIYESLRSFIRTEIALAEERGRREEMERHVKTLSALSSMWNQYCGNESGHEFMSAGEEASEVLSKYGILKAMKGKIINGMFGNSEVDYPSSVEECEKFFLSTLTQKL